MTGTVGILLALVAGLLVSDRRRVATAVVLPFVAVLAIQTWGIAAGRAVSPPSTVTAFPGAIPYYVVQAIIVALALGTALQVSSLRFRGGGSSHTRAAHVACVLLAALVVSAYGLDRPFFDPGSVTHHSSSGSPPVLGIAGIALLVVVCAVLGCVTLRRRRARPTRDASVV